MLKKFKTIAFVLLIFGFISGTVFSSCGGKKTEEVEESVESVEMEASGDEATEADESISEEEDTNEE
jgi:hypothetical protein